MRKDNNQLSDLLQREYTKKTNYYTHTEVPEDVSFEIDGYLLKIKYPASMICQEINNTNSFEGWANVCNRWGVFDKISFDWEKPADKESRAYQHFLYRVKHFREQFSKWFELSRDAESRLSDLNVSEYVCDKLILESMIDIAWYFETGKKLKIEIPEDWDIHFQKGVVEVRVADFDLGTEPLTEEESEIYSPWQLLINRWAYLPTSPQSHNQTVTPWDTMPKDVQELLRTGFTERNFPYPAEY